MTEGYLEYIQRELINIRDSLLDDSSRTRAAYHLGGLITSVSLTLKENKEIYESENDSE